MFFFAVILVAGSAVWTKQHGATPLAAVDSAPTAFASIAAMPEGKAVGGMRVQPVIRAGGVGVPPVMVGDVAAPTGTVNNRGRSAFEWSDTPAEMERPLRWFGGRPVRPARTVWLTVTAYSPDARSCGKFADGITASNKSIWTNGMKLVAADTSILPMGTMLTIPGYDDDQIVPVLDRGGAIKGDRLDVLFPSHDEARRWGVQRLPVTIWEYAEPQP